MTFFLYDCFDKDNLVQLSTLANELNLKKNNTNLPNKQWLGKQDNPYNICTLTYQPQTNYLIIVQTWSNIGNNYSQIKSPLEKILRLCGSTANLYEGMPNPKKIDLIKIIGST